MRGILIPALAGLLARSLPAQSIDDAPALQAPITIHQKIVTVKTVLDEISQATGTTLSATNDFTRIQICVFGKKVKAIQIVHGIAELEGADWVPEHSGFRLTLRPETRQALRRMDDAEQAALSSIRTQRLSALERLERGNPTSADEEPLAVDSALENPDHWAQRMLHDPAYRALAVAYRNLNRTKFANFIECGNSIGFRAEPPPNRLGAQFDVFLRQPLSESEHDLAKTQILARAIPDCAAIECAEVISVAESPFRHPIVDLSISPIPAIQFPKSPIGALIASWAEDLKADENSPLSAVTTLESPKVPSYKGGEFTQADQLEAFAESANLPVVTDASRLKGVSITELKQTTPVAWLNQFRSQTEGFVHVSYGVVLFRQKRFWRMRSLDIYEPLVQYLEGRYKDGTAGFDEFAGFAAGVTNFSGEGLEALDTITFESKRTENLIFSDNYLLRFPKKIFRDSMPLLFSFGLLDPLYHDLLIRRRTFVDWRTLSPNRSNFRRGGDDALSHMALWQAPYFKAQLTGICADLLLNPQARPTEAPLLFALGYSPEQLVRINGRSEKMIGIFDPNAFRFGCDYEEHVPLGSKGILLVNQLNLWCGFDLDNRALYHMVLDPAPSGQ
jgi:hypothetical protein